MGPSTFGKRGRCCGMDLSIIVKEQGYILQSVTDDAFVFFSD
jgi:hypothetical protein